ncbi:uncharacterized protein LODBEIA_P18190 [Lodderomyces beijingensis]|uniref:RING-type domain-containing protein n=1 Tax=Lodderomyces beijingensis TaxID=1775926 RepID=A0ABP0ZK72_9ASCO
MSVNERNADPLPPREPGVEEVGPALMKLLSSSIQALWDQSEQSDLNRIPWNRLLAISKYCCSIYGLSCLVMALVLNRTLVMASTNNIHNQRVAINRQRQLTRPGNLLAAYKSATTLKRVSTLCFRLGIIALLICQLMNVLVALKLNQSLGLAQTSCIGWFYRLIPARFFSYDPQYFDNQKYMKTPAKQVMIGPTSDMYWPIFLTFCLSSFIETFIASIQGQKPFTESGITIFEHSLAFQEFSSNAAFFFSNSYNYKRPTEEVLMTSLFSILNHLNIHVGAILNGNRLRLIPSSVMGLGFLAYFVNSIAHERLIQFPYILILTLAPQILIIFIVLVSGIIFLTAAAVNGFQFQGLNYASFFTSEEGSTDDAGVNEVTVGQEQESPLSSFNINLTDDFYTALLNLGVLAITSAGKSSYITELSLVTLDTDTWIERSIWQEIKSFASMNSNSPDAELGPCLDRIQVLGYNNIVSKPGLKLVSANSSSGADGGKDRQSTSGSVFKRRRTMCKKILVEFGQLIYGILVDKIFFNSVHLMLRTTGIKARGVSAKHDGEGEDEEGDEIQRRRQTMPKFLRKYVKARGRLSNLQGSTTATATTATTVTTTTTNTDTATGVSLRHFTAEELDSQYVALIMGGRFEEVDDSEDFVPETRDESEAESDAEEITFNLSDRGSACSQQELAPVSPLLELFDSEGLNEILNGNDLQMTQRRIQHGGRLTRSRYQQVYGAPNGTNCSNQTFSEDEGRKLIDLMIERRKLDKSSSGRGSGSGGGGEKEDDEDEDDEENDNSRSLDCVICQTNMREIITWPCKCFAICEPCRLRLVSKGIQGCVCCRSEVRGVSKIFIP